jgi:hypothetical protein
MCFSYNVCHPCRTLGTSPLTPHHHHHHHHHHHTCNPHARTVSLVRLSLQGPRSAGSPSEVVGLAQRLRTRRSNSTCSRNGGGARPLPTLSQHLHQSPKTSLRTSPRVPQSRVFFGASRNQSQTSPPPCNPRLSYPRRLRLKGQRGSHQSKNPTSARQRRKYTWRNAPSRPSSRDCLSGIPRSGTARRDHRFHLPLPPL